MRPRGGGGRPHAQERGLGRAGLPTPGARMSSFRRHGDVTCCLSTWSGGLFIEFKAEQDERVCWSLWVAEGTHQPEVSASFGHSQLCVWVTPGWHHPTPLGV